MHVVSQKTKLNVYYVLIKSRNIHLCALQVANCSFNPHFVNYSIAVTPHRNLIINIFLYKLNQIEHINKNKIFHLAYILIIDIRV